MTDIKRVNYFTSQFLGEKDFIDEQAYHLEMRRRHNRLLHSWGIADGGFPVTKASDKAIAVGAGTAIDKDGKEIVLLDPVPVDFSKFAANQLIYVTARYDDKEWDEADKDTATGHYTRKPEKAKIEPSLTPPATDGSVILLAEVKLDANGNIESPINGVRKTAGSRGDAAVQRLTVEGDATLKKTLRVEGSISFGQGDSERLTLWDPGAAIGIQASTVYARSHKNFAWFSHGKHSGKELDPGDGGTTMMLLTNGTLAVAGAAPLQATAGANTLDVQRVKRTNPENHPKGLALYVTSDCTDSGGGIEFRHSDATRGIGFGSAVSDGKSSATIYAAGSAPDQYLLMVPKGKGEVTFVGNTNAGGNLTVEGDAILKKTVTVGGSIKFGSRIGELVSLWNDGTNNYAIGIQASTAYSRTHKNFAWYKGGTHVREELEPGTNGTTMMSLTDGTLTVSDKFIAKGDATLEKTLTIAGNNPPQATGANTLDIQRVPRTTRDVAAVGLVPAYKGEHSTGLALYVTYGTVSAEDYGVEFRHSDGTQGIGFGHTTIRATGSDPNQPLRLQANGTGRVEIKQENWVPVSVGGIAGFKQGWANYGGGFTPAEYFKDSLGIVHLRGLVQRSSGTGNVIFALLGGYRAGYQHVFSVASGHTQVPCRIDVRVNGEIVVTAGIPTEYVSLDGISFRAA